MEHCKVHYMNDIAILYRIYEASITAKLGILLNFFMLRDSIRIASSRLSGKG